MGKKVKGTIAIMGGIPSVPTDFCWSLVQMVQYNTEYLCPPGEIINYEKAAVSYHSQARNDLAKNFQGDWLMMLDCDHAFDPDLAGRMLALMDATGIDILTALYHYKQPPHPPVAYAWDESRKNYYVIGKWPEASPLFEIDAAGAGSLMIRRRVLDRIFSELGESPFDSIHPWSEDFSFFRRAKQLGFKAYCAPQIESFHLASQRISSANYDRSVIPVVGQKVDGRVTFGPPA